MSPSLKIIFVSFHLVVINDFIELFSLQPVRENRLPYRRLEQLVARWPHEPKVADSSSAPATTVFFN